MTVGTPFSSGPPSVAVDGSGNALIAWANTKDLGGSLNFVQYCVLPVGATACSHSGNLQPADSAQFIDGVHVLSDASTMIILADVFGAAGNNAQDYTPDQEWQSTDGGATWALLNGGLSVTTGILNADTGPLSAVIVPGTGVLGFGWDTAVGAPTFNAFPLSAPPECSVATCPAGFATLEPDTNPDQIGNPFGQFAAQAGAQPGVLGVFDTNFTNGPLGCATSFGTAFVYGSGNQSASNSYNISPGQPNSAWKQGWAAWLNNGSVFAQSFQAADAISPVSVGGSATDTGTTITVSVTCTSLPCTVTITITSSTVTVHTSSLALKKKRNVTLAKGRFTITKSGAKKLSVKLTSAGKKFLASKKGHIKVGSVITETVAKHSKVIARNLTLAIKPKKGK